MKRTVITFVISFLVGGQALCYALDGNDLLKQCLEANKLRNKEYANINQDDLNLCIGYIEGFMDMNGWYTVVDKEKKPAFCPPWKGLPKGQIASILVKYLQDHPEQLHKPSVILVVEAMKAAFPCK